eukprot:GFYU01006615.1.p1 GENE.GFYU01006615.1~~GFYU01006615.1.p1  ORF type:complete len:567 (+),score=165.41 GFYU01006615.1:139-1839(+)
MSAVPRSILGIERSDSWKQRKQDARKGRSTSIIQTPQELEEHTLKQHLTDQSDHLALAAEIGQNLIRERESIASSNQELLDKLEEKDLTIDELMVEVEELQAKVNEKTKLEQVMRKDNKYMEEQIGQLKEQLLESEVQIEKLIGDVDKLQSDKTSKAQEVFSLRHLQDEHKQCEETISQLRAELDACRENEITLRKEKNKLMAKQVETNATQDDVDFLRGEVDKLTDENKALKGKAQKLNGSAPNSPRTPRSGDSTDMIKIHQEVAEEVFAEERTKLEEKIQSLSVLNAQYKKDLEEKSILLDDVRTQMNHLKLRRPSSPFTPEMSASGGLGAEVLQAEGEGLHGNIDVILNRVEDVLHEKLGELQWSLSERESKLEEAERAIAEGATTEQFLHRIIDLRVKLSKSMMESVAQERRAREEERSFELLLALSNDKIGMVKKEVERLGLAFGFSVDRAGPNTTPRRLTRQDSFEWKAQLVELLDDCATLSTQVNQCSEELMRARDEKAKMFEQQFKQSSSRPSLKPPTASSPGGTGTAAGSKSPNTPRKSPNTPRKTPTGSPQTPRKT